MVSQQGEIETKLMQECLLFLVEREHDYIWMRLDKLSIIKQSSVNKSVCSRVQINAF